MNLHFLHTIPKSISFVTSFAPTMKPISLRPVKLIVLSFNRIKFDLIMVMTYPI